MQIYQCKISLLFLTFLIFAGTPARADTIHLKDGSVIKGKVIETIPGKSYKIKRADGTVFVFKADEVEKVNFEEKEKSEAEEARSLKAKEGSKKSLYTRVGLETAYLSGHTTYHISFDNSWEYGGHGESKLEFPLDNYLIGLNALVGKRSPENPGQDKARLSLRLLVNIDDEAGIMKDSDWIENDAAFEEDPHPGRDLYTESDAELDAWIFDLNYVYNFFPSQTLGIGPILGYRYQNLKYEIYGAEGIYWDEPVSIAGDVNVLDYRVKHYIPYLGLNSDLLLLGKNSNLKLNLLFGYSPWVGVKDKDDHLLRGLTTEANTAGEAYLAGFNGDWQLGHKWTLSVRGEYIDIDTTGIEYQYAWWWFLGTVDDNITSSYWNASVKLSYRL